MIIHDRHSVDAASSDTGCTFMQLANGDSKKKAPTIPEGTAEATKNITNYEYS